MEKEKPGKDDPHLISQGRSGSEKGWRPLPSTAVLVAITARTVGAIKGAGPLVILESRPLGDPRKQALGDPRKQAPRWPSKAEAPWWPSKAGYSTRRWWRSVTALRRMAGTEWASTSTVITVAVVTLDLMGMGSRRRGGGKAEWGAINLLDMHIFVSILSRRCFNFNIIFCMNMGHPPAPFKPCTLLVWYVLNVWH